MQAGSDFDNNPHPNLPDSARILSAAGDPFLTDDDQTTSRGSAREEENTLSVSVQAFALGTELCPQRWTFDLSRVKYLNRFLLSSLDSIDNLNPLLRRFVKVALARLGVFTKENLCTSAADSLDPDRVSALDREFRKFFVDMGGEAGGVAYSLTDIEDSGAPILVRRSAEKAASGSPASDRRRAKRDADESWPLKDRELTRLLDMEHRVFKVLMFAVFLPFAIFPDDTDLLYTYSKQARLPGGRREDGTLQPDVVLGSCSEEHFGRRPADGFTAMLHRAILLVVRVPMLANCKMCFGAARPVDLSGAFGGALNFESERRIQDFRVSFRSLYMEMADVLEPASVYRPTKIDSWAFSLLGAMTVHHMYNLPLGDHRVGDTSVLLMAPNAFLRSEPGPAQLIGAPLAGLAPTRLRIESEIVLSRAVDQVARPQSP